MTGHITDSERIRQLEARVKSLEEDRRILWDAVIALGERVAEATQVEEIIRRAHLASDIRD